MTREQLDELRGRWDDRMRWTKTLREKYERDQTDENWQEYREMMAARDACWKEYKAAMPEFLEPKEDRKA